MAIGAIAAGMICFANAGWIHAKARLGQWLIASAWQREREQGGTVRPWPWADTYPVARLTFADSDEPLYVLETMSGQSLAWGPAHDMASAPPGEPGNSVLAGHRDTHFAGLRRARLGDEIVIENRSKRVVHYRVSDIRVIDSRRTRIALGGASPRLTLVTCYPFDALRPGGPLRWVVTADLAQ
jgi:sortase A